MNSDIQSCLMSSDISNLLLLMGFRPPLIKVFDEYELNDDVCYYNNINYYHTDQNNNIKYYTNNEKKFMDYIQKKFTHLLRKQKIKKLLASA